MADLADTMVEGSESIMRIDARLEEVAERMREIDSEHADKLLAGDPLTEWNTLGEEQEHLKALRAQMEARKSVLADMARDQTQLGRREAGFAVIARERNEDLFDIASIRGQHGTAEGENRHYVKNARKVIEHATFYHPMADQDSAKADIERMLKSDEDALLAKHILITGSEAYQRAWTKQMMQWAGHPKAKPLTSDEEGILKRAMSTGTSASGGYAVPYTLDPTLVHTSNLSVNPWRAVCRVVTITTNEWRAVTSGSVTATRQAEAGTASDAAPTLTQPSGRPTRVQSFIPFSVEIDGDWPEMQAEMASLIQEAKDDEEAASFYNASGTAPAAVGLLGAQGLTTSQRVQTTGTAAFAIGDVYALQSALPARIRPRSSYLGSNFAWNKIRQFDTAGGAGLFAPTLRDGLGQTGAPDMAQLNIPLLGRPAYEMSSLATSLSSGNKIIIAGDFSRFVIVDRVGMNVELIPMIQSGGAPTGQRGIYAWWRNQTVLVDANAFRYLEVL